MPALIPCPTPRSCGVSTGHLPGSTEADLCARKNSARATNAVSAVVSSAALRTASVTECPERVNFDELDQYVDGYEGWMDASMRPHLREETFTLMQVRLDRIAGPMTAFDFVSEMDFDEESDAEEELETYQGLAEAIAAGQEIPPLVLYISPEGWREGAELLDGNHRAGLGLSEGVEAMWAYVAIQEGSLVSEGLLIES